MIEVATGQREPLRRDGHRGAERLRGQRAGHRRCRQSREALEPEHRARRPSGVRARERPRREAVECELHPQQRNVVALGADRQEPRAEHGRAVREEPRSRLRSEDPVGCDAEALLHDRDRACRASVDDAGDRPAVEQPRPHGDLHRCDSRIDGYAGSRGRRGCCSCDCRGQHDDHQAASHSARSLRQTNRAVVFDPPGPLPCCGRRPSAGALGVRAGSGRSGRRGGRTSRGSHGSRPPRCGAPAGRPRAGEAGDPGPTRTAPRRGSASVRRACSAGL